jgi:CDP-diacylglycerol--glycerol-3-phosphate 3-phosphatidyltransferase
MNLPIIVTFIRILLIPAIIVMFYLPWSYAHLGAAVIFILASFTDWLDGYLARVFNQTTKFGAFLDPVADKLIVAVALVIIVGEFGTVYIAIPAAIIVGRELIVSALREWMAELGKRTSVAVGRIGKIKTTVQMISLILLLLYYPHYAVWMETIAEWVKIAGIVLLYAAAVLTLWSMFMYLKAAWPDLTLASKPQ